MWRGISQNRWLRLVLIASVLCVAACSTQRQTQEDELAVNADDPFNDPFFTQPPAWDDSVLQQSEVLTEKPGEFEQPKTLVEKGEGFIFSTLIVGASLAKMALPFIGF
jgi:hypothetical protein